MRIALVSPIHFERWDWRNAVERGIGGSETCHCELAWRLARRGHAVTSYAPLPDDCPGVWRQTQWKDLEPLDADDADVWIVFRDAAPLDALVGKRVWLLCQDERPVNITPERLERTERVIALCAVHAEHLHRTYGVPE